MATLYKFILSTRSFCFLLIIISCYCFSCIDPIEFEVPSGLNESVVVQGRIVLSEPSFVEVNVSRLFDFSPASREPISIKELILYDSEGNQMELETRSPGRYKVILDTTTPIQVSIGKGYHISLITFDGRSFESTIDVLTANTKPDQLFAEVTQTVLPNLLGVYESIDQVTLSITTEIDNSLGGGYYWEVRNVFAVTDTPYDRLEPIGQKTCYIDKLVNVNDIYVLDPSELNSSSIEKYELSSSLIDWRFAEGLYYEVRQYSLSEPAYAYWNAVNTLSERDGNMFDGPIGEIPTNLASSESDDDQIFGYFFATQEYIIRLRFDRSTIPPVNRLCPPPPERMCSLDPGEGCTCGLCCDCLIEPSASIIKPDYWID